MPKRPNKRKPCLVCIGISWFDQVGYKRWGIWLPISNIKDNPKNLTISELDASQTASSLPSVDAAIINNTFVREAGIDYKKALFVEKANSNSKQWYNLIAAKKDLEII